MATKNTYFRGQGSGKIAVYGTNAFARLGEVDRLVLSPTVEVLEHVENESGKDYTDLRFLHTPRLNFTVDIKNVSFDNFMRASYGVKGEVAPGAIEVDLGAVLSGFDYRFGAPNSTVSAVTSGLDALVEGVDYKVNSDGTITFTDAFPDVTVSGAETAVDYFNLMTAGSSEVSLIFEGLNTITGKKVTVTIGRATLMPAEEISLVSKDLTTLTLNGMALYDPEQPQTGLLGGYGSFAFQK